MEAIQRITHPFAYLRELHWGRTDPLRRNLSAVRGNISASELHLLKSQYSGQGQRRTLWQRLISKTHKLIII
jgi:hypothetical protein